MEATAVSVGKSALDGALSYAKSAIAEEVTLQLGIQRDQAFIRDELQMMQSFLMAADKDHGDHGVLKTWVKQVRDVAYDVEDCLQDCVVRLENMSWWRLPCTKLREGHRIAKEMKELRAKVEDVSQRNMRYHLINSSASASATSKSSSTAPGERSDAIFRLEARRAAKQEKVDLAQLITKEGNELRVMAVWGSASGGDVRMASIVRAAYQKVKGKFECRAWVRLMHPFNPKEFIANIVRQFHEHSACDEASKTPQRTASGVLVLNKMEAQDYNLVADFDGYVTNKRYLVVLIGLATIEDWDWIKTYLPDNHHGGRIVVCAEHSEVASWCIEDDGNKLSEIQQEGPFINPLYVYYKEDSPVSQHGKSSSMVDGRALQSLFAEENEASMQRKDAKSEVMELISKGGKVIAIWGTGGVGKCTGLARSVYDENLGVGGDKFLKRAWVTMERPFSLEGFLKTLLQQLHVVDDHLEDAEKTSGAKQQDETTTTTATTSRSSKRKKETGEATRKLLAEILSQKSCLLVIDDIPSTAEWDLIAKMVLPSDGNAANRIIVTATEFSVAIHCSGEKQYTYKLEAPSDDENTDHSKKEASLANQQDNPQSSSNVSAGSMLPDGEHESDILDPDTGDGSALQILLEEDEAPINRNDAKSEVIRLVGFAGNRVISVWGMGDVGKTTLVRSVYEELAEVGFQKRAWISMENPFSREKFVEDMLMQLCQDDDGEDAGNTSDPTAESKCCWIFKWHKTQKSKGDRGNTESNELTRKSLPEILSQNQCLVVIDGVSSSEEWDFVKENLPDDGNPANRIIVTTREFGVAIHCSGEEQYTYKLQESHDDDDDDDVFGQLKNKVNPSSTGLDSCQTKPETKSSLGIGSAASNSKSVHFNEIVQEDDFGGSGEDSPPLVSNPAAVKKFTRSITMGATEEAHMIGRREEKDAVIDILSKDSQERQVISVWGMGGIGKTTLARSIYQSPQLEKLKFERRAWVTVLRPFRPIELLRSLAQRLLEDSPGKKQGGGSTKNDLTIMGTKELRDTLFQELDGKKYLIILDDLSSTSEWDSIIRFLPKNYHSSRIIVTTRSQSVALCCSKKEKNMHNIEGLTDEDALELFANKVSKESDESEQKLDMMDFLKENLDMMEEAENIIKKCGRLPLAIATVGGFLSTRPRNIREWRNFSDHISEEFDINPSFETIKQILNSSYDGLPYHLKSCFLYLSIFPEDHNIRHGRLLRRWIAEGYSREVRSKTAEEVAEKHFTEIINRSMIQQSRTITSNSGKIGFCQVHDLMREISISKSEEENLVFILDERSTRHSKDKVRHLVVSQSWSREKKNNDLESIVDVSHIRSLTVFGEWKSFFFSKKMRMLRVLDLEDANGLQDRDLVHIGKLCHLKYLSLRGSATIFHLPDSFGNLLNLETLDIRGTFVTKLPGSIGKLKKLKYLRAGMPPADEEDTSSTPLTSIIFEICRGYISNREEMKLKFAISFLMMYVHAWLRNLDLCGIKVPKGIGRLRAMHTLGVVNIARGEAFLKNLKKFTQLRKLGVTGINKNNCKDLCSAIVDHGLLNSLLLRAEGKAGLENCLDGLSPAPKDLESLKLYGNLVTQPKWIGELENLQKLTLSSTNLQMDVTIHALGELPNLGLLRLLDCACKEATLHFPPKGFKSLTVIELVSWMKLESLRFEEGATPKLEVLSVDHCWHIDDDGIYGVEFLSSLKEVLLEGAYYSSFKEDLRKQLDNNKNKPNLKIV